MLVHTKHADMNCRLREANMNRPRNLLATGQEIYRPRNLHFPAFGQPQKPLHLVAYYGKNFNYKAFLFTDAAVGD